MASESRLQLESWLKGIDVAGKVLDVGSSQLAVKGRTKSFDVDDYKTLDLKDPHNGGVPDIQWDMNLPCRKKELKGKFDVVFFLEVFEYLWNPYQALKNAAFFLKKGGTLYVSLHFQYKFHPPEGLDYLRYTPFGAEKLLKEAGFEIVEHRYKTTRSVALQEFYADERMRGKTRLNDNITGSLIKATI